MIDKKIRTVFLASAAALLFGGTASAADIPARMEPAAPIGLTALDWSGFYAGVHLGLGATEGRATYDDFNDFGAYDTTPTGWLGGAQAGYNWQFGRMVYGVEIDGSWANIDGYQSDDDGATFGFDTSFLASARFRSGIAIDNVLLFGSIGLAYSNTDFRVNDTDIGAGVGPTSGRSHFDRIGLASGFGAAWAFAPHWSLSGEYIYYYFNNHNGLAGITADDTVDNTTTNYARLDGIHTFRVALNYHFGGASEPMIAEPDLDWSGFYVGAHGGYGMSRILGTYDEVGDNGSFDFDPSGFVGGLQAGYNWQSGAWVYGLEADGTWSGMDDRRTTLNPSRQQLETTTLASLRGRIGIAAGDKLFYLTGGLGYVRSKFTNDDPADTPNPASVSISEFAPVIGSGAEWAFAPNWNVRLEGLTYFANDRKNITALTDNSDTQDFIRQSTVSVIRAGVNYRF